MRFVYVLFFALWQLTAIPFVALLTANTVRQEQVLQPASNDPADNYTVVYKSVAAG